MELKPIERTDRAFTPIQGHLEAILLLFIGPSAPLRKSVMPGQFELYGVLAEQKRFIEPFEERPFHKGWRMRPTGVIFACPFKDVDEMKYPCPTSEFENRA